MIPRSTSVVVKRMPPPVLERVKPPCILELQGRQRLPSHQDLTARQAARLGRARGSISRRFDKEVSIKTRPQFVS
jgi:hypothetical protein